MIQPLTPEEIAALPDWARDRVERLQVDLTTVRAVIAVLLVLVGVAVFLLGITFGGAEPCHAAAPSIYGCPHE